MLTGLAKNRRSCGKSSHRSLIPGPFKRSCGNMQPSDLQQPSDSIYKSSDLGYRASGLLREYLCVLPIFQQLPGVRSSSRPQLVPPTTYTRPSSATAANLRRTADGHKSNLISPPNVHHLTSGIDLGHVSFRCGALLHADSPGS